MSRDSWPPLLRGLGTTFLLIGALIAFAVARHDVATERASRQAALPQFETEPQGAAELKTLRQELERLKAKIEAQNVAEEFVESPWLEWMGLIGTSVIASSFYVEAVVRTARRS